MGTSGVVKERGLHPIWCVRRPIKMGLGKDSERQFQGARGYAGVVMDVQAQCFVMFVMASGG